MKSHLGFNRKFRGKVCVHLLKVCFNNHKRFIRILEFATNIKPIFLVIPEGEKGRGWENLKSALSSMSVVPPSNAFEKRRQYRVERVIHNHVGPLYRSFANVVRDEGPRRGGLVPFGRWARAMLRRWLPKENSEVEGKLEEVGLSYGVCHFISGLSKARIRIAMKDRSVLPALIEVIDGDWMFTISVAMVGDEEVRKGRAMGESTRVVVESHSGTGGGRWEERVRSTAGGSFRVGEVGRKKKKEERRSPDVLPVGTRAKRGQAMGNNWFSLNSKKLNFGPYWDRGWQAEEAAVGGKGKGVSNDHDVQTRGSVKKEVKSGSKKLWTTLFPPSSDRRQGSRSHSEPLLLRKPLSDSEELPKEEAFGEKAKEGFLGRVGSDLRGSSVTFLPSNPEIRGKGLNFLGNCGLSVAENLESTCSNQLPESFNPIKTKPNLPSEVPNLVTVSQGDVVDSPSGDFQIEGLSPKKMAKVHEVLSSLDIKETKKVECDRRFVGSVWSVKNKEWVALQACKVSGGILIIWDSNKLRSEEVVIGSFSVSIKFALDGYGPLCGDFNVIRRSSEKLGGSSLTSSMKDFDGFIRECELLDPPLRNAPFTWSNMQEFPVCKRLDRFMYSNEWEHYFPQSLQEALPRRTSDHWPIVLETNPFKWGPTPFRKFIKVLENERGIVLNNSESIIEEILLYFEKLYSSPTGESWRVEGLDWSPISEESASGWTPLLLKKRFIRPFFSWIGISSGSDGFTIAVFQDCWDVIKEDLVRVYRVSQ
ncbi:hypothetical protein CK203_115950 [Vitis vinifera]|uniref:DUF4283 domain-containing protein n=1 Tax=Vitis vinifera TaxID=29760 RepID=A0A438C9K3_VITVI|nr:hypothetical protein CK203_115950 [Vitis vinifera]